MNSSISRKNPANFTRLSWLAAFSLCVALVTAVASGAEQTGSDCVDTRSGSDFWIDNRLEATYLFNPHLNNFRIDTQVREGVVHLSGTVSSEIDKDLAERIAQSLQGVKSVESDLEVREETVPVAQDSNPGDEAPASATEGESFGQKVADFTTTARIRTELFANQNLESADIDVATENGKVSLTGTVGSSSEKQLAGLIAKNSSGSDIVSNELKVVEKQTSS